MSARPLGVTVDAAAAVLRASRNYTIPPRHRPPFGGRCLLPPRAGVPVASLEVDRQVAGLLHALREPRPLPDVARAAFGERASAVVAELVLDGLLEVEHEGRFVSGIDAVGICCPCPYGDLAPRSATARLSVAALQYAALLDVADVSAIAGRLYGYNQRPLSPMRVRAVTPADAAPRLDIRAGAIGTLLHRHWRRAPQQAPDAWTCWVGLGDAQDSAEDCPTYKLYVSPDCSVTSEAVLVVVATLADVGAPTFKIACGADGPLRPDKIVVYARGRDHLDEMAAALAHALGPLPPHGVPFTVDIAGGGLLSWGLDPPPACSGALPGARASWREWVTGELARSLALARMSAEPPIEPWRFALLRLRARGVDVTTWTPYPGLWRSTLSQPRAGR